MYTRLAYRIPSSLRYVAVAVAEHHSGCSCAHLLFLLEAVHLEYWSLQIGRPHMWQSICVKATTLWRIQRRLARYNLSEYDIRYSGFCLSPLKSLVLLSSVK